MIVYEMRHPESGLIYVGATTNSLKTRISTHKMLPSNRIWEAFDKYGFDSFTWTIVFEAQSMRQMMSRERALIKKYRKTCPFLLLNHQCGGGGSLSKLARKRQRK